MLEISAVTRICHRTRNNGEIVLYIVLIAAYIVESAIVDLHVGGVIEHGGR